MLIIEPYFFLEKDSVKRRLRDNEVWRKSPQIEDVIKLLNFNSPKGLELPNDFFEKYIKYIDTKF